MLQRDLAKTYDKLAEVHTARNDPARAKAATAEAARIRAAIR
jgi:hypothetical protein